MYPPAAIVTCDKMQRRYANKNPSCCTWAKSVSAGCGDSAPVRASEGDSFFLHAGAASLSLLSYGLLLLFVVKNNRSRAWGVSVSVAEVSATRQRRLHQHFPPERLFFSPSSSSSCTHSHTHETAGMRKSYCVRTVSTGWVTDWLVVCLQFFGINFAKTLKFWLPGLKMEF
jgi:hypothetical protein